MFNTDEPSLQMSKNEIVAETSCCREHKGVMGVGDPSIVTALLSGLTLCSPHAEMYCGEGGITISNVSENRVVLACARVDRPFFEHLVFSSKSIPMLPIQAIVKELQLIQGEQQIQQWNVGTKESKFVIDTPYNTITKKIKHKMQPLSEMSWDLTKMHRDHEPAHITSFTWEELVHLHGFFEEYAKKNTHYVTFSSFSDEKKNTMQMKIIPKRNSLPTKRKTQTKQQQPIVYTHSLTPKEQNGETLELSLSLYFLQIVLSTILAIEWRNKTHFKMDLKIYENNSYLEIVVWMDHKQYPHTSLLFAVASYIAQSE